ncbi:DinB family protein [Metabacillus sp. GX 13764]|uniref:DinB family protein n=1 Tax=Metabacillus kandeliae TaxID=2900151 RepID=UPI001E303F05|nr:DinB family protein [Metabacillus kandeliae]MCD7034388.1 DinB family protein [Metabacillus kandeliae]
MKQRQEIFFSQLQSHRDYLLHTVKDVTQEEADIIPNGFSNSIRWNLGHVYTEQYMWLESLTKERAGIPEAFGQWFGWGSSPKIFTEETPSFEQLKQLLKGQISSIKDQYEGRLEEEFEPTEIRKLTTIEQVLLWTSFHEGMHLQGISDLKRIIRIIEQQESKFRF